MIELDLSDIQGNIHRPYGRFGFPITRHLFFNVADPVAGRHFVQGIRPRVTTAEPWGRVASSTGALGIQKPPITLNIGFTFLGFLALGLPTRTLRLFPDEFIEGMRSRARILGDVNASAPDNWNPIWRNPSNEQSRQAHVWVSLNVGAKPDGSPLDILDQWTRWLEGLATNGVTLLAGHGVDGTGKWQDAKALMQAAPDGTMVPLAIENFGFRDGISDPVFRGQFDADAERLAVIGGGKIAEDRYERDKSWSAIETGEFILGQVDEGQEFPVATEPSDFARNGTFMVLRKLRQDVEAFDGEIRRLAALWKRHTGVTDDNEASETVCAKIVGRWRSGIPLTVAPSWAEHQEMMAKWADCFALVLRKPRDSEEQQRLDHFALMLTGFRYGDDPDGAKCPLGAHIRRANPRDMLDPLLSATAGASTLTNRRRLLRRGLPYQDPDGERGVMFMGICSSPFRQFEFIQQQWINYGLDFDAGNDSCPLIGSRAQSDKHVIPAGPANDAPFIAAGLPEFVTTRGGDYFFLPSTNAIRMVAMGTVDPT
jgi:deferrochelatase/peroxidase EfeB